MGQDQHRVLKPTLTEQIRCVEREIRMRQRVYPGLVDRGKKAPAECDRELVTMGAVLETLKQCEQLAKCLEDAPRVVSATSYEDVRLADTPQALANLRGVAGHEVRLGDHVRVRRGDNPEGVRFIRLSDTLAKKIAAQLRGGDE